MKSKRSNGTYLFIAFILCIFGFAYWLSTPEYTMGKVVNAIATENIDDLKRRVAIRDVSLLQIEKYFISSELQNEQRETDGETPKFKMREVEEISYKQINCSRVLCEYLLTINYADIEYPVFIRMNLIKDGTTWLISKIEDAKPSILELEQYFSE